MFGIEDPVKILRSVAIHHAPFVTVWVAVLLKQTYMLVLYS